MDYIIASTVVTDEIRFADKKTVVKKAGGAGIYALCGIRLWCSSVMPVTGVGRDYGELFGDWYQKNHISMEGLIEKDEKTPYNIIQYFEDGERSETALYGADHYRGDAKRAGTVFSIGKGDLYFQEYLPGFLGAGPSHDGETESRRLVGDRQRFHLSGMPGRGEADSRKCGYLFDQFNRGQEFIRDRAFGRDNRNIQGMAGQFESLCTAESFADGFSAQRL